MAKQKFDLIEEIGRPTLALFKKPLSEHVPAKFPRVQQIRTVLDCCLAYPTLFPRKGRKDQSLQEYAYAWVNAYVVGFQQRRSQLTGQPSKTVSDPLLDVIAKLVLSATEDVVIMLREGHRFYMLAENTVGELLEEYIEEKAIEAGWALAWGQTMRSVDLCHPRHGLLQIKNRSNSENSSSSAIRIGTDIKKWYRLEANSGDTNWTALNDILHAKETLSEQGFHRFLTKCFTSNHSLVSYPPELNRSLKRFATK